MAKNIDMIIKNVEHNLNKASIKEANGLSSVVEEKALGQNLVEILESDFWKECMEDDAKLLKASQEKYPEYYMPIVAEDPLVVVYDRVLDIIPKLLASAVIIDKNDEFLGVKVDSKLNRAFTYLWRDLIGIKYWPGDVNDEDRNESDDTYFENGFVDEYFNEIKRLINKYKIVNTSMDKRKLANVLMFDITYFSGMLNSPKCYNNLK